MMRESKGDPNALSTSGAIGLMQIIAEWWGLSKDKLWDPEINIYEGCKILSDHINDFGSERDGLWAYYSKNQPYSAYADPVLNMVEDIKTAYSQ
jgi:soluble lytic murein transglycosylase-like protein